MSEKPLSPELQAKIEEFASKLVYRKCSALVDGVVCGLDMKFAGRCRSGHDGGLSVEPLLGAALSGAGLRMPEGYKPQVGVDNGDVGRTMKRVVFDDADDLLRRFLPDGFIRAYEMLVDESVGPRALGSGRGYDEVLSGGSSLAKGFSSKSEGLTRHRAKVDRKLRKLGREIIAHLDGKDVSLASRKCSGKCKRIGDGEWIYCPNCGGPMSEVD